MVTSIPFLMARVTDEKDFLRLKELAITHDNWHLEYDKNGVKIWSKAVPDATIKMIKVWAIYSGIKSSTVYNALMDPMYRKEWDNHMLIGYDIGHLNSNNGVSYYAVSCPPPLRSRDFVLQTSWLDKNSEHYMLNHSVCHRDHPPRPGFIRAVSYFTGFYIKAILDDGCELTYVSQTDPQGIIPSWIVNKCTQIFAPRYVKEIEKAALGYRTWKDQNNPNYLPWLYPEQIKTPKISVGDCVPSDEEKQSPFFRYLAEKELKKANDEAVGVSHHNIVSPGPSKISFANRETTGAQKTLQGNPANDSKKKGKQKKSATDHLYKSHSTIEPTGIGYSD